MTQKSSWEQFFDAHAPIYDENIFTKNTIAEVDFLSQCLKPGAKVLLTVLSAARLLRMYSDEDVRDGRFDPLTLVETSSCAPREGLSTIRVRERAFVPTELVLLCGLAGLRVVSLWGGTAGNWGRRPLDLDEYEIMLVAQKTPAQEAGLFDFPSRRPQQSP